MIRKQVMHWIFLKIFPGPVLLEDYHLVEKLANFDRERIPERVVHARGASAKGFFEVTHDISQLTCADFLRTPGVQTPVIVRFSTVIHERGSPETLRDPRGFAVKFYTREVWHIVNCEWLFSYTIFIFLQLFVFCGSNIKVSTRIPNQYFGSEAWMPGACWCETLAHNH